MSCISLLVPCGIIAAATVPLMLNLVPPNGAYGFRTRETLADSEVWFRVNRFAGCALFVAAGLSAAVLVAYPRYDGGLIGVAVLVVPMAIACVASLGYARRIGRVAKNEDG